ncbi:MAG: HNH endonuclease [Verrucomicrobia bacterium]|nr:HNH endonuclease [Verrucomicrobiota bacterium]
MSDRPAIPIAIERAIKIEAGHRCAIPNCRHPKVEIAHIIPWTEVQEHTFENLIALCPNCHDMYDKEEKIDRKSMLIYKANLGLLNYRYGEFERRVLQFFCDQPIVGSI